MKQTIFLLFFLSFFPVHSFAQLAAPAQVASYDGLVREVKGAFVRGSERAQDAVERERVQTYWEVGKLIDEHILLNRERAEYGAQVIKRLSADLGISARELHYMVEFARAYPIVPAPAQLSWSHYRELLSINDAGKREKMAKKAAKKKWTQDELRSEIKKLKAKDLKVIGEEPQEKSAEVRKGELNTYQIVSSKKIEGQLLIDLGFSNYLELPKKYKKKFKEKDIVKLSGDGKLSPAKGYSSGRIDKNSPDSTQAPKPGYTYKARVLEVVDGDTLWLWIDLGFGISTKQRVRLRSVDAPEITTRDGIASKEFVIAELRDIPEITITSIKDDHDQWDRYLVDVFYTPAREDETSAGSTRAKKHEYVKSDGEEYVLSNELLKRGLATKIE